jgi:tRNA uridine 5-carbamoylmethylation protein Kti12
LREFSLIGGGISIREVILMPKSDEISEYILSRVQLSKERAKQVLRDLENVNGELNALYDYAMNHDMEDLAEEIAVIEFDLNLALNQVKELIRELMVLEYEVEEDEQEE